MTRRKLVISLLIITAVLLIGLYFYFEATRDYREIFKDYVKNIMENTRGFTYIKINSTITDVYSGRSWVLVMYVDNNVCSPGAYAELYYNGTLVAEYGWYYRESDGARIESFKVHNEDLLNQFINEIIIDGG